MNATTIVNVIRAVIVTAGVFASGYYFAANNPTRGACLLFFAGAIAIA